MSSLSRLGVLLLLAAMPAIACAQSYPTRPVRFIIPFAPGGGADLVGRAVGQRLAGMWGQSVIVDNRPGAGANIAAAIAARAAPDGHTVYQINIANAISVSVYRNLAYDPVRDFAAVTLLGSSPFILVSHPGLRAQNVRELIALAKAEPGRLNYASSGTGGPSHLLGELFRTMAQIDIVHVPYASVAPALNDLLPGRIQLMFVIPAVALPHIASGRLRAFGVSSAARTALAPQLPTIAESGLKGFEGGAWYGVVVPVNTPRAIVTKLAGDFGKVVRDPGLRERFAEQGIDLAGSSPEEFAQFIKSEIAKFSRVAATAGLRP